MPAKPRLNIAHKLSGVRGLEVWLLKNSNLDPAIGLQIALRLLPLTYNSSRVLKISIMRSIFVVFAGKKPE